MKKKNILISIICLLLAISIILVILIGQANRNYTYQKHESEDLSLKKVYSIINTFSSKINPIKIDNSDLENTSRFEGVPLTSEDIGIPVLCYHDVNPNNKGNNLLISPQKFKDQMLYLKNNMYTTLTLDELYGYLRENKEIPKKSVVITFDDGYKGNYKYAFPILKELGLNATIFMVSDYIGNEDFLTEPQLKELCDYGIDIQSHTADHSDLPKLSLKAQISTLEKSKKSLEKILNKPIDYIAYPYGKLNDNSKKAAEATGYKMAFNLNGSLTDKKDNIYNLDRVYISNSYSLETFVSILTSSKR